MKKYIFPIIIIMVLFYCYCLANSLSNVFINGSSLFWDPYSGATEYVVSVYQSGDKLGEHIKEYKSGQVLMYIDLDTDLIDPLLLNSGIYTITLYARNTYNGVTRIITDTWSSEYTYVKTLLKGDINNDKKINIIDVKLLLQICINCNDQSTWNPEQLEIMDMNIDGKINIIDVKLLLQICINS